MSFLLPLLLIAGVASEALWPRPIDSYWRPHGRGCERTRTIIKPTLFVRTHKTGSSTLTAILHRLSDVHCAAVFVVCRASVETFTREWNLTTSEDRARLQRVHVRPGALHLWADHLIWNNHARFLLPPRFAAPPTVITLLRHPIDQFRSACTYWSQWACNFTALVAERRLSGAPLRSGASWFASQFFDQFRHFEPRESVHDTLTLVNEHWELSMVALAHVTGAPCADLRVNSLKVSSATAGAPELGGADRQWLEEQLADDIGEYERAVLRLHRFVAALPAAFRDECLAAYRAAPAVQIDDEAEWTRKRCAQR